MFGFVNRSKQNERQNMCFYANQVSLKAGWGLIDMTKT